MDTPSWAGRTLHRSSRSVCLDEGSSYDGVRDQLDSCHFTGDTPHIRLVGEDVAYACSPDTAKWSWHPLVERSHSWLTRSQRLLVRWETLKVI